MTITASSLEVLSRCGAMAVLEHADWAGSSSSSTGRERGSVIHRFLADVGKLGLERALAAVPPEWLRDCQAIDVSRLPACDPESYAHEVAFAIDWQSGEARELGRDIGRRYEVEPIEIAGTCDVLGLQPDRVVIYDYKTGFAEVPEPRVNWQLKHYAYAAAKVYGREAADVAIIRIGPDGRPWSKVWTLTREDLEDFFGELRELMREAVLLSSQKAPPYVLGSHCKRCPAVPFCPAVTGILRNLAVLEVEKRGEPAVMAAALAKMGPEAVSGAYERWQAAKAGLELVEATLRICATQAPILLEGGKVWGPISSTKPVLDGGIAFKVLQARFGDEVADEAVKIEASESSVSRALKAVTRQPGQSFAALEREVLAAIEEAGGYSRTPTEAFRKYDPAKQAAKAGTTYVVLDRIALDKIEGGP